MLLKLNFTASKVSQVKQMTLGEECRRDRRQCQVIMILISPFDCPHNVREVHHSCIVSQPMGLANLIPARKFLARSTFSGVCSGNEEKVEVDDYHHFPRSSM